MMRRIVQYLVIAFGLLVCWIAPESEAFAQNSPDTGFSRPQRDYKHGSARNAAELGFATLFGTISGGSALITSIMLRPDDLSIALLSSAILYPIGVGSGAILGSYIGSGRSGYWEPFVGAFAGAIVADVTAYYLSDDYPILSAVLVIVLPLLTTMIAVETSHGWHWREDNRNKSQGTAIMPLSFGFGF